MSTMKFIAFFTENSSPKTGLSPTIDIWKDDGDQVITAQPMSEISSGFYKYEYTAFDVDTDYVIRADGTTALPTSERYHVQTNGLSDVKSDSENLLKVQKNKWDIISDVLTIYDDDETTPLYEFELFDDSNNPSSVDVFRRVPK